MEMGGWKFACFQVRRASPHAPLTHTDTNLTCNILVGWLVHYAVRHTKPTTSAKQDRKETHWRAPVIGVPFKCSVCHL